MALADDSKLKVFLILGIPTIIPQDFDPDGSKKEAMTQSGLYPEYFIEYSQDLINAVNARFSTLTSTEESFVLDVIEQWEAIMYEVVHVKTDKIELSFDKKRSRLRGLLRMIFPMTIRDEEGGYTMFPTGSSLSIG